MADLTGKSWMAIGETDNPNAIIESFEAAAGVTKGDPVYLSAEYYVDAKTQTLETLLELGREQPLLADYMFRLKSKTDSLSRYKLARA